MITSERIEEMRRSHLRCIQSHYAPLSVRRVSEEYAEALGELLERRFAEDQKQHAAARTNPRQLSIYGAEMEAMKERELALTVAEEGVAPGTAFVDGSAVGVGEA